jgi:quinoprotein glucose dehydrogenase
VRLSFIVLLVLASGCGQQADPQKFNSAWQPEASAQSEWRHYLGDASFSHASSLNQIDTENVHLLEEAWRYQAGGHLEGAVSQMQCNPLIVHSIMYCTAPNLVAFALNAETGEELWRFEDASADDGIGVYHSRGVTYWESGDDRRIFFSARGQLFALNAHSGKPVSTFGNDGSISLHAGLPAWAEDQLVIATTPGTIYKDLLILGTRVGEFAGSAPGHVRAFDARTGEVRWLFRTIPEAGSFGADTWPEDALERAGGANSWAGIAVDHQRGIAFVPTGSATFDFYGGDRQGDNLFANSLLALDAESGERIWHYQFVRHDVWDRDLPAPPNLVEIQREGKSIPAVAQATKTGHVFLFHRETGELLNPVREEPVMGEALPGDKLSASQPLPTSPPAFINTEFVPSQRSPEAAAYVGAQLQQLAPFSSFTAPSLEGAVLYPGMDGGAEWGGMAYDADTNYLYVNANEVPYLLSLVPIEAGEEVSLRMAYLMMCAGCHGGDMRGDGVGVPSLVNLGERMGPLDAYKFVRAGGSRMPAFGSMPWYAPAAALLHIYTVSDEDLALQASQKQSHTAATDSNYLNAGFQRFLDHESMPASNPPWGSLNAIDLNRGELAWRIPFGNYPKMLDRGESGLGSENYGGPVITAGNLLFIGATPDRMFKAYDKRNGKLLWQTELPAAGFATPSVYAVNGRQYIVIAAGGGKLGEPTGSQYLAFALPEH